MRVPKRIRLNLPQKPHGPPSRRLYSFQREWVEARNAEATAAAVAEYEARADAVRRRPAATFVELAARQMELAELSMKLNLSTVMLFGVELDGMPANPPPPAAGR